MIHKPVERGQHWHPIGCRCGRCTPATPSDRRYGAVQTASVLALAGFAAATVAIEVYALLAHVPGIEVVFQ